MTTKGRRRAAIAREMNIVRTVVEHGGGGSQQYYRELLQFTKGKFDTALRYAIEDGMIRQEGRSRGARLYPTEKATQHTQGIVQPLDHNTNMIALNAKWETKCSYCLLNDVVELTVQSHNDEIDFESPLNKATAIRQSFHLCRRCFDLRMPSHAEFYEGLDWMAKYPEWDNSMQLSEQKVLKFVKWFYAPDNSGSSNLYGCFSPMSDDGEVYEDAQKVHIRFTFAKPVDGNAEQSQIQFARGYKYFHKMFGHPNNSCGKTVVISREPHKTGGGKWFWSWTPYPRIPLHIKRQIDLDKIVSTDTEYDDIIPEDASLPQHQIHSIVAEGDFTVIKIRRGSDDYKNKFHQLQDIVLAFLAGEIGLIELENTLQGSE